MGSQGVLSSSERGPLEAPGPFWAACLIFFEALLIMCSYICSMVSFVFCSLGTLEMSVSFWKTIMFENCFY